MATFDQLTAEQRSIIELVLKHRQTYAQLGEMLATPEARVRGLACDALLKLAPLSAVSVDEGQRGPIADYLLGQQSEAEAVETMAHLRGSEGARAWSVSVLDSLEQLFEAGHLPAIPDPDGAVPVAAPAGEGPAAAPLSPEAQRIVKRRRTVGAVAGVAAAGLLALALLVWPVGLLTGDDDAGDGDSEASRPSAPVIKQLTLVPVEGSQGQGIAATIKRGDSLSLIVQARLPPTADNEAYEVWLYNSDRDALSLGAQVTDRKGAFQGANDLPEDYLRYEFIDVSRERVDRQPSHSGRSVLRGRTDQFRLAGASGEQGAPGGGSP